MKTFSLIIILLFLLKSSFGTNNSQSTSGQKNKATTTDQLNISILLDLSDRISPKKNPEKPEHYQRDIANVKYITELFVKEMELRGAFMAKGKIKVIFSPKPTDPNVNLLAEKLNIDLSPMDVKQKKLFMIAFLLHFLEI